MTLCRLAPARPYPRLSYLQRQGSWVPGTVVWRQPLPSHPPCPFWGFPAPDLALCCAPPCGLKFGVSDMFSESRSLSIFVSSQKLGCPPALPERGLYRGGRACHFALQKQADFQHLSKG